MFRIVCDTFLSIFFDISKNKDNDIFDFQNLRVHFLSEIPTLYLDEIYVGTSYEKIAEILELYKYRSRREYASTYVDILSKVVEKSEILAQNDTIGIVPVPMHWTRYAIRGFNHIDKIGIGLAKKLNISYFPTIGTYYSKRQSKLSKSERIINRRNAFFFKKKYNLPDTIILIDDIISTGSTANVCAQILKENGVKKVFGIFIASNQ